MSALRKICLLNESCDISDRLGYSADNITYCRPGIISCIIRAERQFESIPCPGVILLPRGYMEKVPGERVAPSEAVPRWLSHKSFEFHSPALSLSGHLSSPDHRAHNLNNTKPPTRKIQLLILLLSIFSASVSISIGLASTPILASHKKKKKKKDKYKDKCSVRAPSPVTNDPSRCASHSER